MGRKTFESIGKPLPGRRNIILTTQKDFTVPECITVHTVEQALAAAGDVPEIMVIGGGEIYQLFYPLAQTLYITYVDADLKGNTRFVPIDPKQWREIDRQEFAADEKHQYAYSFVTLARIAS
jgi:dihydrofolate reductase